MNNRNDITYIGITNFRNTNLKFGIKDKDRLGHIYVIGKTGVGKSTLLKSMAIQDIQRGNGVGIIDPHGDVAKELLLHIPKHRTKDLIYFNPINRENIIAFNPLYKVHPNYHHLVASGLVSTFKKIWLDSWGPRLEYILRYSLLTLLWFPDATLLDIQPLLTDSVFRNRVLLFVEEKHIHSFWKNEFEKYPASLRAEAITPILNKTGLFINSVPLRNVVGRHKTGFRMQTIMDEGKIFIANLSKGEIGEDAASVMGSMLVNSFQLAAMQRAKQKEEHRKPYYLFIDECHSFITLSFADILAEARKYGLSLFLAHQYINQLQEPVRAAIFGNVGTIISFRVGAEDAAALTKEFYPEFDEVDLINLPIFHIYIKLLIDGVSSKPFSANQVNFQK